MEIDWIINIGSFGYYFYKIDFFYVFYSLIFTIYSLLFTGNTYIIEASNCSGVISCSQNRSVSSTSSAELNLEEARQLLKVIDWMKF